MEFHDADDQLRVSQREHGHVHHLARPVEHFHPRTRIPHVPVLYPDDIDDISRDSIHDAQVGQFPSPQRLYHTAAHWIRPLI